MFTYILRYVSWRVDRFDGPENHQAKPTDFQLKCGAFFFFLVFFCLTVRNNASKQQTYKELNLYLRRYNIVLSCSIELFCLFFLNQARTPLVTLKCCCRFCEA